MKNHGSDSRPTVAVVYRYVPHYRREFYEMVHDLLAERGITFRLLYGDPGPEDAAKLDAVDIPWGEHIRNRIFRLRGKCLYWQECLGRLHGVDLVVVEQATRLLVNYPLLARQAMGCARVALWGGRERSAR